MQEEIVFEDNHLLVINKKAGLLVQSDQSDDEALLDSYKQFIKKRDKKPNNVWLETAHRLDRPVSGVLIFAKSSKIL